MRKNLPYIEPSIRTIAGFLLTLSGLVVYFFPEYTVAALLLMFFVSLNLAQSGFSRFCMMEQILKRLGFRSELEEIHELAREREQLQAEEKLLHGIDQQVLHGRDKAALLRIVCTDIARTYAYPYVWIGKKQEDGNVLIVAWAGERRDYYDALLRQDKRWSSPQNNLAVAGQCINSGQMVCINDIEASQIPSRDMDLHSGFRAVSAIPLFVKGKVYGAITLYAQDVNVFDEESWQRLNAIASRISVALEMAMDQEQLQLLGAALASAGNGAIITDQHARIQWVNDSFTRLTGYSAEEVLGKTPSLLKSGEQDVAFYQSLWDTLLKGRIWSSEIVERHKNGKLFTAQQTITPIMDDEGRVTHFVSILDDISAQKEASARIHYMAHFDALTALPNRTLFYDRLYQSLAQARRDARICALMFLDLDRFKIVNDTLGHHVGDLLLRDVAGRIKSCVRESDTVSRLAGDEFTVLLPHVNSAQDAALVAEKITVALSQPFHLDGHEVSIGSSIGIAFYPHDADNDEDLVRCADIAMYAAKAQGRGTFRFYQLHHELAQ